MNKPAPVSRITDSATSTTTRTLRAQRPLLVEPRPYSFKAAAARSAQSCNAGPRLKPMADSAVINAVNASTPHENQIRTIRARKEQDTHHSAHEKKERGPDVTYLRLLKVHSDSADSRIHRLHNRCEVRLGLYRSNTRAKPPDHVEIVVIA